MPSGNALFGSSASRSQNKNLIEIKAGKMTMKGKMVYPDKRKGLIYIHQSEDSLMHFCWKDRSTGAQEDDLIIFPDDVEFKKVPQCTTGRVYLLKFKSSSRKFFFWVQEPKTDKDEDNCRRVNELLNNPPSLGSQRSGGATPDGELHNLLSNMSQQQLMQLFGGVGQMGGLSNLLGTMSRPSTSQNSRSSTTSGGGTVATNSPAPPTPSTPPNAPKPANTTPAAPAKSGTQPPIQLSHLQSYLSGLGVQNQGNSQQVDLSSSITAESLQAILNDPNIVRELQRYLPPAASGSEDSSQEQLRSTLASPQFQQAVSMFSTALQSGQLGPLVSEFEMGTEAVNAANLGNMEEFVRALQAATISQPAPGAAEGGGGTQSGPAKPSEPAAPTDDEKPQTEPTKKDNEDEDMNLD